MTCPKCDRAFKNHRALRAHERMHKTKAMKNLRSLSQAMSGLRTRVRKEVLSVTVPKNPAP